MQMSSAKGLGDEYANYVAGNGNEEPWWESSVSYADRGRGSLLGNSELWPEGGDMLIRSPAW